MATIFRPSTPPSLSQRLQLHRLKGLSPLLWLIIVNVAIFLGLRIVGIAGVFSGHDSWLTEASHWLSMPASLSALLHRPWTILTYMVTQVEVFHIIFNMLWLYWFATIFLEISSNRQLLWLYLWGGLGGALLYILSYNIFPGLRAEGSVLLGASAAIIAIVVATALRIPNYKLNLLFLGPVAVKWVALVTIVIDCISLTGDNTGGHIAHLGGALAGVVFVVAQRLQASRRRRHPRFIPGGRWVQGEPVQEAASTVKRASATHDDTATLDAILDKIKSSGYASLTPEERKRLFDVSNRIK
ncbi:MAG: rhomboid family intramembrane serine protease [Bacteroidales bacterium]|nr:rhomboid family intramembrane serine protease [Bacteroidales bacterium]